MLCYISQVHPGRALIGVAKHLTRITSVDGGLAGGRHPNPLRPSADAVLPVVEVLALPNHPPSLSLSLCLSVSVSLSLSLSVSLSLSLFCPSLPSLLPLLILQSHPVTLSVVLTAHRGIRYTRLMDLSRCFLPAVTPLIITWAQTGACHTLTWHSFRSLYGTRSTPQAHCISTRTTASTGR